MEFNFNQQTVFQEAIENMQNYCYEKLGFEGEGPKLSTWIEMALTEQKMPSWGAVILDKIENVKEVLPMVSRNQQQELVENLWQEIHSHFE